MTRAHLIGLLLAPLIALPCIWYGQLRINPQARLLLVPHTTMEALQP